MTRLHKRYMTSDSIFVCFNKRSNVQASQGNDQELNLMWKIYHDTVIRGIWQTVKRKFSGSFKWEKLYMNLIFIYIF